MHFRAAAPAVVARRLLANHHNLSAVRAFSGYTLPAIMPPHFDKKQNWRSDTTEVYKNFVKKYGKNSPLVTIGTGIIAQGLHEFARSHNHPFVTGGVDNGLDVTSKRSIRGFIKNAINVHGLKEGDSMAVFNGAAFLSAHPNIAGSIDVNVGGAINLIIVAQEIMKDRGINLVILTPSSIARDQLSSPYGTGKRLVENLTSFQNLSTPTDFRSVILPGLISGLNPIGGSTDTPDELAKHVAHLVVLNEANEDGKPRVRAALGMSETDEFYSRVKVDRKVSMAGIKDVISSMIQVYSLDKLPLAIPICGGEKMSYSVADAENALKKHLGNKYPSSCKLIERLGIQQKNLEEWGPIGICLPNVDKEWNIRTAEEDLDISVVHAFEHYKKLARQKVELSSTC